MVVVIEAKWTLLAVAIKMLRWGRCSKSSSRRRRRYAWVRHELDGDVFWLNTVTSEVVLGEGRPRRAAAPRAVLPRRRRRLVGRRRLGLGPEHVREAAAPPISMVVAAQRVHESS